MLQGEGSMIQVGILGGNSIVLSGLRAVLEKEPEIEVVEFSDPRECDVLVLCRAPGLGESGLPEPPLPEPAPALLVISDNIEPFRPLLESADRGQGLLPEHTSEEEVVAAIRALAVGLCVGSTVLMRGFLGRGIEGPGPDRGELSPREAEVLQLLSLGLLNKEIAFRLQISEHTVKYHISSIFSKLGAANRVEAIRAGIRLGLVDF